MNCPFQIDQNEQGITTKGLHNDICILFSHHTQTYEIHTNEEISTNYTNVHTLYTSSYT